MGSDEYFRRQKCAMISQYGRSENVKGLTQMATTLVPFALLWWAAIRLASASLWLAAIPLPLIILLTVRSFGLMHECGHGSLFRSPRLNRAFGFVLGLMSGMPQYVWSQHHNFHHAHNGNWDRYRGPCATPSVDEYASLTPARQRLYRLKCSILAAPIAGFMYLVFNPRFTWMKGSIGLVMHTVASKLSRPTTSLRDHAATYRTRYWKSAREYRHMLANNLVLLGAWTAMCLACGAARFLPLYIISVSVAGGLGIVLFTVQHNFRHSFAGDSEHWDQDTGAIEGTSYLVLPGWLNWFTVDIGYHHVHHLSASIPNYRLAACHEQYQHLFANVTRITLRNVPGSLKCILWDRHARRIISVAEYQAARALIA